MSLSPDQISAVELRVANERKSAGLAYVLLVFTNGLGIHNLYLGKWGRAIVEILLTVFGFIFMVAGFVSDNKDAQAVLVLGLILTGFNGLMLIWDLFSIPRYVRRHSELIRNRVINEYFPIKDAKMQDDYKHSGNRTAPFQH